MGGWEDRDLSRLIKEFWNEMLQIMPFGSIASNGHRGFEGLCQFEMALDGLGAHHPT